MNPKDGNFKTVILEFSKPDMKLRRLTVPFSKFAVELLNEYLMLRIEIRIDDFRTGLPVVPVQRGSSYLDARVQATRERTIPGFCGFFRQPPQIHLSGAVEKIFFDRNF
jgi:hypothetical protein